MADAPPARVPNKMCIRAGTGGQTDSRARLHAPDPLRTGADILHMSSHTVERNPSSPQSNSQSDVSTHQYARYSQRRHQLIGSVTGSGPAILVHGQSASSRCPRDAGSSLQSIQLQ